MSIYLIYNICTSTLTAAGKPLVGMFPEADVPVVTLSVHASFDPALHLRVGRALSPLRERDVLILASGQSFHNISALLQGPRHAEAVQLASGFDDYLIRASTSPEHERNQLLQQWRGAPGAPFCHPQGHEEHLAPLFVAAGAAQSSSGRSVSHGAMNGYPVTSFVFE